MAETAPEPQEDVKEPPPVCEVCGGSGVFERTYLGGNEMWPCWLCSNKRRPITDAQP
jgi:hypothetical protein